MDLITTAAGWEFLLRYVHLLAGTTWIGVLYYFNFIQTPFFGTELGGQAKSAMTRGLVPNALWWFRWGAMFTFLSGWTIVLMKWGHGGIGLGDPYMTRILTGGLMGTLMWANVWFVIWPAQQVVIANALRGAGETWAPTAIHIVSYFVVMIPAGWIFAFTLNHGALGLIGAIIVASAVSVTLLSIRFVAISRQKIKDP